MDLKKLAQVGRTDTVKSITDSTTENRTEVDKFFGKRTRIVDSALPVKANERKQWINDTLSSVVANFNLTPVECKAIVDSVQRLVVSKFEGRLLRISDSYQKIKADTTQAKKPSPIILVLPRLQDSVTEGTKVNLGIDTNGKTQSGVVKTINEGKVTIELDGGGSVEVNEDEINASVAPVEDSKEYKLKIRKGKRVADVGTTTYKLRIRNSKVKVADAAPEEFEGTEGLSESELKSITESVLPQHDNATIEKTIRTEGFLRVFLSDGDEVMFPAPGELKKHDVIKDDNDLTAEELKEIEGMHSDANAGPEQATGMCKIRGHVFGMQINLEDFDDYTVVADPDLDEEGLVDDWNSGEILMQDSSDGSDKFEIPDLDEVVEEIKKFINKVDKKVSDSKFAIKSKVIDTFDPEVLGQFATTFEAFVQTGASSAALRLKDLAKELGDDNIIKLTDAATAFEPLDTNSYEELTSTLKPALEEAGLAIPSLPLIMDSTTLDEIKEGQILNVPTETIMLVAQNYVKAPNNENEAHIQRYIDQLKKSGVKSLLEQLTTEASFEEHTKILDKLLKELKAQTGEDMNLGLLEIPSKIQHADELVGEEPIEQVLTKNSYRYISGSAARFKALGKLVKPKTIQDCCGCEATCPIEQLL